MIISDSDTVLLGDRFQEFIKNKDIIHNTAVINDHASLGIIDRFALMLKSILTKHRQIYNTANWKDILNKVIKIYNDSSHKGIKKI